MVGTTNFGAIAVDDGNPGNGTPITLIRLFTPVLTPAATAAASTVEQTFSVPGLTTADTVLVSPPVNATSTGIAGARVSAADTLAIKFVNPTAGSLTHAAGAFRILAFRT